MIRTVLTMQVRAGCEEDFREAWESVADRIARYPGNRGQSLARQRGHERTYVITGDWADWATFTAFQDSPDRLALSARLDELREWASKTVLDVDVTVPAKSEGVVA